MDTIMLRYEGGGGLINSHGSCGNNPGLFINQHFCLVLCSDLPASFSCSTLSQHTALTLSYLITTRRTLVLLFVLHTRGLLLETFVLCIGNNLAAGSVTLKGSFLNLLLQDIRTLP